MRECSQERVSSKLIPEGCVVLGQGGAVGTGLCGGTTCIKAQRQDSIVHLDNWKKLLMANLYTHFKFPFKHVPCPYPRETPILPCSLKAHNVLEDSSHYMAIYLVCSSMCAFVCSSKERSSMRAGNYV